MDGPTRASTWEWNWQERTTRRWTPQHRRLRTKQLWRVLLTVGRQSSVHEIFPIVNRSLLKCTIAVIQQWLCSNTKNIPIDLTCFNMGMQPSHVSDMCFSTSLVKQILTRSRHALQTTPLRAYSITTTTHMHDASARMLATIHYHTWHDVSLHIPFIALYLV